MELSLQKIIHKVVSENPEFDVEFINDYAWKFDPDKISTCIAIRGTVDDLRGIIVETIDYIYQNNYSFQGMGRADLVNHLLAYSDARSSGVTDSVDNWYWFDLESIE